MEDLIQEYQQTLKIVLKAHKEATVERERLLLGRMVSDLRYAIQWMAAGRQPEVVRGMERRAAYQREVLTDPHHFDMFKHDQLFRKEGSSLSTQQIKQVKDVLRLFSPREKEVYLMSRGQGISFAEIASLLGISRGAVGEFIRRAEKKITAYRNDRSDFCESS